MQQQTEPKEPFTIPGWIIAPYKYTVGPVASKFFTELRDNKRILGIRCPECNRVLVPPRSTCSRCFSQLEEWVEVDTKGTLLTYTIVHYPLPIHPAEPPFAYGIVQLDGADTGLTHLIGEVDGQDLKIGMRVQAVFKEERQGNILDIKYFRPVQGKYEQDSR